MKKSTTLAPVERDEKGRVKGGALNPGGFTAEEREARDALRKWLSGDEMRTAGKDAYAKALREGNAAIIKDWADRMFGKVKEHLELSEDPDAPLNPHTQVTIEELKAIARAQLEREKTESLQPALPVK